MKSLGCTGRVSWLGSPFRPDIVSQFLSNCGCQLLAQMCATNGGPVFQPSCVTSGAGFGVTTWGQVRCNILGEFGAKSLGQWCHRWRHILGDTGGGGVISCYPFSKDGIVFPGTPKKTLLGCVRQKLTQTGSSGLLTGTM